MFEKTIVHNKIVHISDLHFGNPCFDWALWGMVKEDIAKHKPGIIIVSGDIVETPRRKFFKKAKTELDELCEQSNHAKLILVPGNHDVAIKGNINLYRLGRLLFTKYFDFQSFWNINGVSIACFDSSYNLLSASGRVNDSEIYPLSNELSNYKTDLLRIAILHHHPLPIPYSERKGVTEFEPFLVLRNAGTFLQQLYDLDFDLILHGHKHYAHHSKINLKPNRAKEINILSAGSASLRINEPGRNSYNLLTIYKNGHVDIEEFCFGGGKVCNVPSKVPLLSIPGRKLKSYVRHSSKQLFETENIIMTDNIHKDGTTFSTTSFFLRNINASEKPISIKIDKGRLLEVCLDRNSLSKGFSLETEECSNATAFEGKIKFGSSIMGKEQLDYTINQKMQGSVAMTQEEFRRIKADTDTQDIFEETSFFVVSPLKKMMLTVKFPENFSPIKAHLEVTFDPNIIYPDEETKIDDHIDVMFYKDREMEEFERQNLIVKDNEISLQIDYPLVGYDYKIKWELPEESMSHTLDTLKILGETKAYQRELINYIEQCRTIQNAGKIKESFEILWDVLKKRYGSFESKEIFTLTLMGYDEKSRKICMIDGVKKVGNDNVELSFGFKLEPGVGNAGMAYKLGRPILYVASEATSHYYVQSNEDGLGTKYEALLSIPVFHPNAAEVFKAVDKKPSQDKFLPAIGIINIGSSSSATKLFRVQDTEELGVLLEACQLSFAAVLKKLTYK